jgi:phospho-N-acetylmuramoyl-pentapeptide-transferase
MLYWLFYQELFPVFSPFRVFSYITFRTAYASITALVICLILGPWLIRKLRAFQIGQIIREEGPQSHKIKQGTPTMGGLLINISILVPTLLWADLTNAYVWIAVFALTAFGAVGFADDYLKITRRHNLGLNGKAKLALQIGISLVLGVVLAILHARGQYSTNMNVPFFKFYTPDLLINSLLDSPYTYPVGFIFFFLFVSLVLVGASNAVNLTDGLDGLAIGLTIIAAGALTVLTYAAGHAQLATYFEIQRVPQAAELTVFCG